MEGTGINMISNACKSIVAASAPDNQQEEAMVSSPPKEEQAKNTKKARIEQQVGGSGEPKPQPPQDAALRCPRCCSMNTKFCYYNNYNLNQPRYFCKACRRYWTQGGTLRQVPIGGAFRRNKRASSSSSSSSLVAASSTAATSAEVEITVEARMKLTELTTNTTTMSMPSPTTSLFPDDMLPPFTPIDGSSFDFAVGDQQDFLPFASLPSFDSNQAPKLPLGGSDYTTPSFLDMLTGGNSDCGGSSSYGADLDMSGCNNGMNIPFPLLEMGALTTDPIQMQLMKGMNDVADELQWASLEHENYINDDGGYAAGPVVGVQQQQQQQQVIGDQLLQVVGDQQQQVVGDQQEEDKKAKESRKNNNDDGGSSSVYNYCINTNKSYGAEG